MTIVDRKHTTYVDGVGAVCDYRYYPSSLCFVR